MSVWMSLGIDHWVQEQGFAMPMCVVGGLILAIGFVGIPMAFCGRRWRQYMYSRWGMNDAGALRPH